MNELLKDSELRFPHCMVLKASAGAGKTRALTARYVQFLLSERIPHNSPKNILAITFSNNAAKEMKERILKWLKNIYFKDEETLNEFIELFDHKQENKEKLKDILSKKAAKALEELLNNYSDFQVKTIDSFMTSVFKASAVDFGYNPDFEILMNNKELFSYAFELFLKDLRDGSEKAEIFKEITDLILEMKSDNSSYLWDPAGDIFRIWRDIYEIITANASELRIDKKTLEEKKKTEEALVEIIKKIMAALDGFEEGIKKRSVYQVFPEVIQNKKFEKLFKHQINTLPIKKNGIPEDKLKKVEPLWKQFQYLLDEYAWQYSIAFYIPYIEAFHDFLKELQKIKMKEGKLFIEDINKTLSAYLESSIVPDIYFRLGEEINHFLIDEFQDTSPLQWKNLKPLIENALSEDGSLFVVGDTKQAIYKFRSADYRIMKQLETEGEKVFPSAKERFIKKELEVNYRSGGEIVRFNEDFFKKTVASIDEYRVPASLSGLTDYIQHPKPENEGRGYIEVKSLKKEEINEHIINLIEEIRSRGYNFKDIAILARKNENVVEISEYLNKAGIHFISYSSLDVRNRKVTSEILALLAFLDSPVDDFSFSVFLKSDIYSGYLSLNGKEAIKGAIDSFLLRHRDESRLYKLFEKEFPDLWDSHFRELFRIAGYLPLYDLLSIILSTFRVFEVMPEEEATFLKLLELAGLFEARGFGNIRDFIEFMKSTGSDERLWDLSLPEEENAVTLMTIHKAKGLEYPVTIVFITEDRNNSSMIPVKSNNGISVMKITNDFTKKCEKLKTLNKEFHRDRLTDELNLFYVAFTRAKDELYILFGENQRNKNNEEKTNLSIIFKEESGKTRGRKSSPEEIAERKRKEIKDEKLIMNISHSSFLREFPVEEREIHLYEKERGEFIHRVLASIDYYHEGIEERVSQVIERLNRNSPIKFDEEEIKSSVLSTINSMKEYFEKVPGRIIKNEREFSDQMGFLYRMDRIVIDPDVVTVIDYKTGHPEPEEMAEHREQVSHYKKILSEIYKDKIVKGLLYYISRKEAIEV